MSAFSRMVAFAMFALCLPGAAHAQTDAPAAVPQTEAPAVRPPSAEPALTSPMQSPPAARPPAVAQAPLYVVVPFGEPGDTDAVLANATRQFSEDLSERRVRSSVGTPTDAVEAVSNAHAICVQYNAAGILISAMRFGQTDSFNVGSFAAGFIPYVGGLISGAGALTRLPITARYKLYLVDCRGKVVWRTLTTASKVHHGNNVAAGLTEIGLQAVAEAADQFAARRSQAH